MTATVREFEGWVYIPKSNIKPFYVNFASAELLGKLGKLLGFSSGPEQEKGLLPTEANIYESAKFGSDILLIEDPQLELFYKEVHSRLFKGTIDELADMLYNASEFFIQCKGYTSK